MNRNTNFQLFDEDWGLRFVDKLDDNLLGLSNGGLRQIDIAEKDKEGNSYPEKVVKMTIAHELIHAILDSGQYMELSQNEPLVEWIARCMYSLKKQQVLDLLD